MTPDEVLSIAIDVRRGFKRFIDINAADRPAVAQAIGRLSDAKLQELLGTRTKYHSGFGEFQTSRTR